MKKRNKTLKRSLGYILLIIGISIPLTGFLSISYRNYIGEISYKNFIKSQESIKDEDKYKINRAIEIYNQSVSLDAYENGESSAIVDPFEAEDYNGAYPKDLNKDEVFAYLRIPKMDLYKPIYLDATWDHMDKGVAQVDGTSLPVGGQSTKSVIAGHRGWWGDNMFLFINVLDIGDKVYVERNSQILVYEVDNFEVIDPSQWEKLLPEEGQDILTLQTCEPFYPPRPYRLLINCKRVNNEEKPENKVESIYAEDKEPIDTNEADKADKNEKDSQDTKIEKINTIIYLISLIGIISLILTIYKFIKYLIR